MSVDDLKHQLSLTLSKQHVEFIRYWLGQVKTVDAMVNLKKDDTRPILKNPVVFNVPVEFMPPYPRTIGDMGRIYESVTSNIGDNKFDYLRTNDKSTSTLSRLAWIITAFTQAMISDETSGSVSHRDVYKQKLENQKKKKEMEEARKKERQKMEENQETEPTTNKNKNNEESDGQVNQNTNNSDNNNNNNNNNDNKSQQDTESKMMDLGDEDDDEFPFSVKTVKNNKKKITGDDNDVDNEENENDDNGDNKKKEKEKKQTKAKPPSSNRKNDLLKLKENQDSAKKNSNVETEDDIRRSRTKTKSDSVFISFVDRLNDLRMKRDMRGISLHSTGEYLTFHYNDVIYPKVYCFIEELEGHSQMPIEKTRITFDAQLYNHPKETYSGMTKEEEDQISGYSVGNGKIVGYRIWLFPMDPSFSWVNQCRKQLREKEFIDGAKSNQNFQPCPVGIFSKALDEISSESDLFNKVLIPYLSYGSGFRNVTDDPNIKRITQLTRGNFKTTEGFKSNDDHHDEDFSDPSDRTSDINITDFLSYKTAFTCYTNNVNTIQSDPSQYFSVSSQASSKNIEIMREKMKNVSKDDTKNSSYSISSSSSSSSSSSLPSKNLNNDIDDEDFDLEDKFRSPKNNFGTSDSQDNVVIEDIEDDKIISEDEDDGFISIKTRNEYQKSDDKLYTPGYESNEDYEFSLRTRYDMCARILPEHFKGFPVPKRVTYVHPMLFGVNFANVVLPHILADVENYDKKKAVIETCSKPKAGNEDKKDEIKKVEDVIQSMFSAKTELTSEEDMMFDPDGCLTDKNSDSNQLSDKVSTMTEIEKLWRQVDEDKITVSAQVHLKDLHSTNTSEFMKQAEKLADNSRQTSQNITTEVYGLLFGKKLYSVKTQRDTDFLMTEKSNPSFPECANGEISVSELIYFSKKNALLNLRVEKFIYSSMIKSRYPDMGENYKRAVNEVNSHFFQKFCTIMMNGSDLSTSQSESMKWWIGQCKLGRIFSSIPTPYANLSIFGNGMRFAAGVWSGVGNGRNNVDLFLMEQSQYWSALRYDWGLHDHIIVTSEHTASKSYTATQVQSLAVEGTYVKTSYESQKSLFTDKDEYMRIECFDEAPPALLGCGSAGKDPEANDYVRMQKEVLASNRFSMKTNQVDKVDGKLKRWNVVSHSANQSTKIVLNNLKTQGRDTPTMQRFLYVAHAKKDGSTFQASAEEAMLDGGSDISSLVRGNKSGMKTNQQDLAKMSLPNNDFIGPDEYHTKGLMRLVHFYMVLSECLIMGGLLDQPSTDVAERLMVQILETYTKKKNLKTVMARRLRQFLNIVYGYVNFEAVLTVLFTEIFYQHLKYEKIIVTSQVNEKDGSVKTTKKTCRKLKDYLNVEDFAACLSKHMYSKVEHVVTACSMAETFITDQFEPNIINCLASKAFWPVGNIQYIRKINSIEVGRNHCKVGNYHYDPRYISVYGSRDIEIVHSIYAQIQEDMGVTVSQSDVSRVLDELKNKLHDASGCIIISNRDVDWANMKAEIKKTDDMTESIYKKLSSIQSLTNGKQNVNPQDFGLNTFSKMDDLDDDETIIPALSLAEQEVYGDVGGLSSSTPMKKKVKPSIREEDHIDGIDFDDVFSDDQTTGSNSSSSGKVITTNSLKDSKSKDSGFEVPTKLSKKDKSKKKPDGSNKLKNEENEKKLNEQFDEQNPINKNRDYVLVTRHGKTQKMFQPTDIERMQSWFIRKYDTYESMVDTIMQSEETRKKLGIKSFQLFKSGEYFWIMFDRKFVETEVVSVAKADNHLEGSYQKRFSVLIEHLMCVPQSNMESAIKDVLDGSSAVESGLNTYMSVKTLVGMNNISGKTESSAYLNHAIHINGGTKQLYFAAPKAGSLDDERYLFNDEQLDNNDYFKIPRFDLDGKQVKPLKIIPMTNSRKILETDEKYYYGQLPGKNGRDEEMTVYQLNRAVMERISVAKGVKFDGMTLDSFGQIRHWLRCGIDPRETLTLSSLKKNVNGDIVQIPKLVTTGELYSSHFMKMTLQNMIKEKGRLRVLQGRDSNIVEFYPDTLWIKEYEANIERSRLSVSHCLDLKGFLGGMLSGQSNDKQMVKYGKGNHGAHHKSGQSDAIERLFSPIQQGPDSLSQFAFRSSSPIISRKRDDITHQTPITFSPSSSSKHLSAMRVNVQSREEQLSKTFYTDPNPLAKKLMITSTPGGTSNTSYLGNTQDDKNQSKDKNSEKTEKDVPVTPFLLMLKSIDEINAAKNISKSKPKQDDKYYDDTKSSQMKRSREYDDTNSNSNMEIDDTNDDIRQPSPKKRKIFAGGLPDENSFGSFIFDDNSNSEFSIPSTIKKVNTKQQKSDPVSPSNM